MECNCFPFNRPVRFISSLGTVLLASVGGLFVEVPQALQLNRGTGSLMAIAQELSQCDPPASDEHLILVDQQTPQELERLKEVLPDGSTTDICRYLNDDVIRVGGFANEEVATAWGQYLSQTLSVRTAIVRPATPFADADAPVTTPSVDGGAEEAVADVTPEVPEEPAYPAYEPQALEDGYAVLVNYADRTDIAIAVQEALGEPVGVAVYRQEPYLLAAYSDRVRDASKVLEDLVDAEFDALIVDSRQVVLMTAEIDVVP